MPELAEVEYFRKRWDAGLGKRIVAVQLHGEKRLFRETDARAIEHHLVRQKLLYSVGRGKQMLFALSGGNWLGIHLGMSGKLRVEAANFETGKHDHLVLRQKDLATASNLRTQTFSDRDARTRVPPSNARKRRGF